MEIHLTFSSVPLVGQLRGIGGGSLFLAVSAWVGPEAALSASGLLPFPLSLKF